MHPESLLPQATPQHETIQPTMLSASDVPSASGNNPRIMKEMPEVKEFLPKKPCLSARSKAEPCQVLYPTSLSDEDFREVKDGTSDRRCNRHCDEDHPTPVSCSGSGRDSAHALLVI